MLRHDINEKLPQKIKVPEHKIDDAHKKIENLRNIILLKTTDYNGIKR